MLLDSWLINDQFCPKLEPTAVAFYQVLRIPAVQVFASGFLRPRESASALHDCSALKRRSRCFSESSSTSF